MKFIFILCALMLLMAGCSIDNPVGREADSPQITTTPDDAACIRQPRPLVLIANYKETVEVVKPPNPPEGDFTLIIEIKAVGFAAHLGPSEMYVYEYVDISTNPTRIIGTDEAYLASRRTGDKLTGWMEGFGYPGEDGLSNSFDGTFHITGGTGEFEGAHGKAHFEGETQTNPDGPNTGWVKFKGYYFLDSPTS